MLKYLDTVATTHQCFRPQYSLFPLAPPCAIAAVSELSQVDCTPCSCGPVSPCLIASTTDTPSAPPYPPPPSLVFPHQDAIFRVVAAILHLGNVTFAAGKATDSSKVSGDKSKFHLETVAELLR